AVNTSAVPRTWALWNVTQLSGDPVADGSGGSDSSDGSAGTAQGVYVGVGGPGPHTVPLVRGDAHPRVDRHAPGVLRVPAQDVVGAAGTVTQRFAVREGATYPDAGSRVQVWLEYPLEEPLAHLGGLRPADRVVECEALGPLTELAPGESTALSVECGLGAGTGP